MWNAQHAWITLVHLRSRGSLEHGFGFHPVEVLSFLGQHFLVYSPFLFLALAWGVIASWRRVNQQFKVLFLMWFGLPVFLFYLLLSVNKAAAPNWDGLAFLGFGLLADLFLVGKTRSERDVTTGRGRGDNGWAHNERHRAGHRRGARGWLPVEANLTQATGCADGKALRRAGKNA